MTQNKLYKLLCFGSASVLLLTYCVHLWFAIPTVPPIHERPYVTFNNGINRGVWGDLEYYDGGDWVTNLDTPFYWTWYGIQNVAIVHWSYGPDGTEECVIHVKWTNGMETCLNAPSVQKGGN